MYTTFLPTILPRKVEYRSSTTGTGTIGTVVINKPAGVIAGDLLLAQISQGGQLAVTPPSGWTELTGSPIDSGIVLRTSIYYRVADGAEGSTFTWTFASAVTAVGVIAAFFGEYPTPIDAQSTVATASGTSHVASSASPVSYDDLLVALYAVVADGTWTPDYRVNERVDVSAGALGPSIEWGEEPLADGGATGTRTGTSTGSASGTAALVIIRRGSVSFSQNVSGALTPAGAIMRQAGKVLAGVLTSAGTLLTALARSIALSGALTPVGTLAKRTNKTLAGTVTSAGALATTFAKSLSGVLTSAGTITRRVNAVLSGGLTTSGSLLNTLSRAIFLSGSLIPIGTLAKRTSKTLAGVVTSAGTLATTFAKSFAGTLTSSGAMVKRISKSFSATLTPTGVVGSLISRSLSGTLTSIGGLAKRANKVFAGTLTSSGVLTTARLAFVLLTGTLTSAGSLVKRVAQSLAGSTGPVGSLVKVMSVTMSGVLSLSGALVAGMNQSYAFVARLYARAYRMLRAHRGP